MSQVVNTQQTGRSILGTLYAPIEVEMAEVESILRAEMCSDYPFVDELVRYGCMLGGKRLRPALLLLVAKSVGEVNSAHFTLGAVVEMIHTATLIHDDVLDEASTRRHLATVNSRWDNESSVLLGDFLFTHAFYLASTLDTTLGCRWIGNATNIVCEGELRQKGSRGDFNLTESDYYGIIEAKTAELVACSCKLGAHFAGASDEVVHRMDAFGRNLGIAFQVADDLLDVVGDEQTTGKSLGTDLEKQKPTLPIIRLLQLIDGERHEHVLQLLEGDTPDRHGQIQGYLREFKTLDYARQRAIEYAREAGRQLEGLPAEPAVETLRLMTEFVVQRSM